jgi:hypothetical protein
MKVQARAGEGGEYMNLRNFYILLRMHIASDLTRSDFMQFNRHFTSEYYFFKCLCGGEGVQTYSILSTVK